MNVLVCKLPVNYRSDASLKLKIAEVDALINELMIAAMKSVQSGNHAEYELDTGQTRTKVRYTSVASVATAIEDYEKLRQLYVNKLNRTTGMTRLMDEKNFRRY